MFQFVFIIVSLVGISFFLVAKRQFDFFTIGFFSTCIYFLPGFFGFALYARAGNPNSWPLSKLLDGTYVVMIVVLIAILIGAFSFDLFSGKTVINLRLKGSKYVVHLTVGFAILGCLATVLESGHELLSINKNQMMIGISRWHILWVVSSSLGAIISFLEKKWIFLCICAALLLLDMFIGFRSSVALTIISLAVICFSMKGKSRIVLKHKGMILLSILIVLILFVYKRIYLFVKIGAWDIVSERLMNFDTYIQSVIYSEPFITQVILNEVVKTNFKVTGEHFIGLFNNLILFSPSLGLKTESFNSQFQPILFPYRDAGMASNIWAEMWSAGGWWLLSTFIIVYVFGLFVGSYFLRVNDPAFKGGVALCFSCWAFYIHRNELVYQITLEKRIFLIWFVCVLVSVFISYSFRNLKDMKKHHD